MRESLQSRVAAYHLEDRVGRIEIPTEPTTELRNGKKYTIDRVFLPGYVFVEMALDNDLWHVVKNTPRVTGFLQTGDQPNALSEAEVNAMLNRSDVTKEKPKLKLKFTKGEQVRITEGPFANFNGAVDDVNEDKQTLKVMVSIFGRPTPTEVSFANVEKAEAVSAPRRRPRTGFPWLVAQALEQWAHRVSAAFPDDLRRVANKCCTRVPPWVRRESQQSLSAAQTTRLIAGVPARPLHRTF